MVADIKSRRHERRKVAWTAVHIKNLVAHFAAKVVVVAVCEFKPWVFSWQFNYLQTFLGDQCF